MTIILFISAHVSARMKTLTRIVLFLLALVSVDMNGQKLYNDTQGHEAGDTALKTVSAVLWENCGPSGVVYRVGGDEFIILYKSAGDVEPLEAIAAMREKMAQTPYVCAFGYAAKKGKSVEDAVRRADAEMYADKAALKNKENE